MKISFKRIMNNVRKRTRETNLDTILSIQYLHRAFKRNKKDTGKENRR